MDMQEIKDTVDIVAAHYGIDKRREITSNEWVALVVHEAGECVPYNDLARFRHRMGLTAALAVMAMGWVDERERKGSAPNSYDEIELERGCQINKWGGPTTDDTRTPLDWVAFITKHAGKAVMRPWDWRLFYKQMIRVAALAIAAAEWADRLAELRTAGE